MKLKVGGSYHCRMGWQCRVVKILPKSIVMRHHVSVVGWSPDGCMYEWWVHRNGLVNRSQVVDAFDLVKPWR